MAGPGADIDGEVRPLGREGGDQAFDEVVDVDQVPDVLAGAPDLDRILAVGHAADHGRRDVADGEVELVVGAIDVGRPDHHRVHRLGDLLGIGPAQDLGVALHPGDRVVDLVRLAIEHFVLADGPVVGRRIGRTARNEAELADPRLVGGFQHQGVDQDVGGDVDQRGGPDDGGARGVGGAEEDIVHALDGAGAVLRLAQVDGHHLGARKRHLQRLFTGGEPQLGAAGGQFQGQVGAEETGATGHQDLLSGKIHFSSDQGRGHERGLRKTTIMPCISRDYPEILHCTTR